MITMQRSRGELEPARETTTPAVTPAVERIELGKRVCNALESENPAARTGDDTRLGAVLAAYATICRRADSARRRAAVAHFAYQLRHDQWAC
jgi:hypothetical protein